MWRENLKYVLYLVIIYPNTTAKACRCLRRDRIFGAERDGASPVSTSKRETPAFSRWRFLLGESFGAPRDQCFAHLPVHLGELRKILPPVRQNAGPSPSNGV
jgi:hypothetical protein